MIMMWGALESLGAYFAKDEAMPAPIPIRQGVRSVLLDGEDQGTVCSAGYDDDGTIGRSPCLVTRSDS
jgi:hypothetical protein